MANSIRHSASGAVATLGVIFCIGGAMAQDAPVFDAGGFYASVFGAAPLVDKLDYDSSQTDGSKIGDGDISLARGVGVNAALGYDFGNGLMLEGQLGYMTSGVTDATYNRTATPVFNAAFGATGSVDATYAMTNLWYGFHLGSITPFIGAGVGVANLGITTKYDAPFDAASFSDSATTYAAQVGAGVSVALTDNVSLTGRYRYFSTGEVTLTDGQGDNVKASYATHIVEAGLKVGF